MYLQAIFTPTRLVAHRRAPFSENKRYTKTIGNSGD
jgi:hypothetical protein